MYGRGGAVARLDPPSASAATRPTGGPPAPTGTGPSWIRREGRGWRTDRRNILSSSKTLADHRAADCRGQRRSMLAAGNTTERANGRPTPLGAWNACGAGCESTGAPIASAKAVRTKAPDLRHSLIQTPFRSSLQTGPDSTADAVGLRHGRRGAWALLFASLGAFPPGSSGVFRKSCGQVRTRIRW